MRQRAHTPTPRCCTGREIGPVDVEDEASRCAMTADEIKEEGTEVIATTILDPPEIGGVEATKTGKGNLSRNAGIVARKATWRESVGRSAPIRREPVPDLVPEMPTMEIGSDRTALKDLEKPDKTQRKLNEAENPEVGRGVVRQLRRVKSHDEP